jgi:hypothetical protein
MRRGAFRTIRTTFRKSEKSATVRDGAPMYFSAFPHFPHAKTGR